MKLNSSWHAQAPLFWHSTLTWWWVDAHNVPPVSMQKHTTQVVTPATHCPVWMVEYSLFRLKTHKTWTFLLKIILSKKQKLWKPFESGSLCVSLWSLLHSRPSLRPEAQWSPLTLLSWIYPSRMVLFPINHRTESWFALYSEFLVQPHVQQEKLYSDDVPQYIWTEKYQILRTNHHWKSMMLPSFHVLIDYSTDRKNT